MLNLNQVVESLTMDDICSLERAAAERKTALLAESKAKEAGLSSIRISAINALVRIGVPTAMTNAMAWDDIVALYSVAYSAYNAGNRQAQVESARAWLDAYRNGVTHVELAPAPAPAPRGRMVITMADIGAPAPAPTPAPTPAPARVVDKKLPWRCNSCGKGFKKSDSVAKWHQSTCPSSVAVPNI